MQLQTTERKLLKSQGTLEINGGFGIVYNDAETQHSAFLKIFSCGPAERKSKFLLAARPWRYEHPWSTALLHFLHVQEL